MSIRRSVSQSKRATTPIQGKGLLEDIHQASAEYKLLLEEQDTLNQQKATLQQIVDQLQKYIKAKYNQALKLRNNQQVLHNEFEKVEKANKKIAEDQSFLGKEIHQYEREVSVLNSDINYLKQSKKELQKGVTQNTNAIQKLNKVILRMKKEVNLQVKERDSLRNQGKEAKKQANSIAGKIQAMAEKNVTLFRQIHNR